MTKKKKERQTRGPVSTLFILLLFIGFLSLILSLIGFQGNKTIVNNGTLEATLVTVRNFFSIDGLKYFLGHVISNFQAFEPLVLLIISLIGIGICEKSGFFHILFSPLKKIRFSFIIFITIFLGVISTFLGDYGYVFLIPFIGSMYKYLNKNPMIGIMVIFLGITLGYGTGLIFNYNDYLLGNITELAVTVDVDPTYKYHLSSNIYIMIASTFLLAYIMTIVINHFLVPKMPRKSEIETEEVHDSKKALWCSLFAGFLVFLVIVYMILDISAPFAGILLDKSKPIYIAKLFGGNAPFKEGLILIITAILIVFGTVYGKISGNIKNSNDYSLSLSRNFQNLGFMFVLMFFMSQIIAILDWTNIGEVIGAKLVEFLSVLPMSGIMIILLFFIIVILLGFFIPDTIVKWQLIAPTVVPLLMRSNITPDFAQFVFKIADSVSKCITPFFVFFIIMLAFLEKYRVNEKKQVSILGTYKLMVPTILIMTVFWLLFIGLWYLIGLPIGVGTYTTI